MPLCLAWLLLMCTKTVVVESTPCLPDFAEVKLLVLHAEPQFGGNTINPIGVILWLVHGLGILAMSLF